MRRAAAVTPLGFSSTPSFYQTTQSGSIHTLTSLFKADPIPVWAIQNVHRAELTKKLLLKCFTTAESTPT